MNPAEVLTGAQETMRADRVFGAPFEKDGVTILPVASVGGAMSSIIFVLPGPAGPSEAHAA